MDFSIPPSLLLSVLCLLLLSLLTTPLIRLLSRTTHPPPKKPLQTPPTLRSTLPFLKSTIPFLFNGPALFVSASHSHPTHPALRIALLTSSIYLIRNPRPIAEIFRTSSLTVTRAYAIALQHIFGMSPAAVSAYTADTSGAHSNPLAGSNIKPKDRVSYLTHENLLKGLLGTGLAPATERFEEGLTEGLCSLNVTNEWVEYLDLLAFFEEHVGQAVLQAIFGTQLLEQDEGFLHDLWEFDAGVMGLARRLPRFSIPAAYRVRETLLGAVRSWHGFAKAGEGAGADGDGDGDPVWGSRMMRERYSMLHGVRDQDAESVASTDLGLIWATITNVIPSSLTLALHIFRSASLLASVRQTASESNIIAPGPGFKTDMGKLEQQHLLLSMYAETLRFGVQIHIPRFSPHRDLNIGNLRVPRGEMILVNTWLAHMDEGVWNTKGGAQPLDKFWPQRFLVDPKDPSSGPTKRKYGACEKTSSERRSAEGPHFSTEGLDGAWIPFGGGHHACPGRLLAKRIMLLSSLKLVTIFDIEILADAKALEYDSVRFGFGVRKPKGKVSFRIRRREGVGRN